MTPDTSSSSSNVQRTTASPRSSASPAPSQRAPWVVPNPTMEPDLLDLVLARRWLTVTAAAGERSRKEQ